MVQVLKEDVGYEKIKNSVKTHLTSLTIAQHSGCHLLRPAEYSSWDNAEDPQTLKDLIKLTGAKCLDYLGETECCGYAVVAIDEKVALQISREKLNPVRAAGAQALVTVCPSCHLMFDTNQTRIARAFDETYDLPVLHYT